MRNVPFLGLGSQGHARDVPPQQDSSEESAPIMTYDEQKGRVAN
jgi:hypothetical protein